MFGGSGSGFGKAPIFGGSNTTTAASGTTPAFSFATSTAGQQPAATGMMKF